MIHNDSMYFNVFQFQCRSSNSWAFSYCNCSPLLHSSRHLASQENSAVPRCATRHLVWPMPEQLSSWWKSVSYGFVWKFGTNQFLVDHDVSSFSYMFLLEIFEIAITWGYPSFFGKSILGGSVSIGLHLNHPFFLVIFQYRQYNLEITHLWKPIRAAQIDSPQKRSSHLLPALYRMLWRRRNSSRRFAWNHGKGCSRKIRSVKLNDTSRNFRSKEPRRLHKLSEWVQISALGAPLQTSSSFANMAPLMLLQ